jgi:hypothetical protein
VADVSRRDREAKDGSDVDKALAKCFASEAHKYGLTFALEAKGGEPQKAWRSGRKQHHG